MVTVPAHSFWAPTRAKLIAALRSMPGVDGTFVEVAAKAGVESGDVITAVNGQSIAGQDTDEAADILWRTALRAEYGGAADARRALEQAQRGEHKFLQSSRSDIPFVRVAKSGQWRTELPPEAVQLIATTDREAVGLLMAHCRSATAMAPSWSLVVPYRCMCRCATMA